MGSDSADGGRPQEGVGHYLRDLVYGALDGVITTAAVVIASAGARLPVRVGVILGIANLIADGISMGASNYLGLKSEVEQRAGSVAAEAPWRHGLATFAAFVVAGGLPLLGYVLGPACGLPVLPVILTQAALTLLAAGALRAPFVRRRAWRSAAEMLAIGILAGGSAYLIGALAERLLR
jgi:VIT1/CCC1 family predicted Fe2+/Mn2+ transporter